MITGKVVSGLGEGVFYVQKFRKNLEKKLKMKIFPGTLNVRTARKPMFHDFIEIKPPSKKFSAVKCAKVIINGKMKSPLLPRTKVRGFLEDFFLTSLATEAGGFRKKSKIKGAIVIPEKTRHEKNILEIVAPVNLRKALKLKDGDSIQIEVVEWARK